uniref:Antifreeze protein n=1 Tax=Typhula ishikariensis TaxID=69361 RepID=UPI001D0F4A0D|nr:Chain A, Antifreeze protein [Typhula ishikariensis]7DDB_B Chain B, Antifreeze protein [Typhula ishikariensis]
AGPTAVPLGTAGNYAILASYAVSTVPQSAITGAVGISPAAGTFLTGFSLTMSGTGTFSTSTQVTGQLTAADYGTPTPSILTTAIGDMGTAYTNGATRSGPDFLEIYTGALGGTTLLPGLYKWTSSVGASADFTISGTSTDTWIFQIDGTLGLAAGKKITLAGGAQAKNIIWVVAGAVSIEAGAQFEGVILAKTAVTLKTGSSLNGRILAQTSVALQSATVVQK